MANGYKEIIKNYFDKKSLIDDNMKSFDNFLSNVMQKLVDDIGEIIPTIVPPDVQEFKIKLDKIWVTKPQITEADGSKHDLYPLEARLRQLTYSAPVYLEVSAYVDGAQVENFTTLIGKIPIMVKSKFCHLNNLKREQLIEYGEDPDDSGGYFILNGNERVLVMVEDLASDRFFVGKQKIGPSKYNGKIFSESGNFRIPHLIEQMKDGVIYLSFTRFNRIPIVTIIKALGLVRDQDITACVSSEREYDDIFVNLYKCVDLKSQDDALDYLGKQMGITQPREIKIEKAKEQLNRYLLPHLGSGEQDNIVKAYNLCKLVKKFLMVAKDGYPEIDKDHYMNKRIKLAGDLLADLFRVNLRVLVNDMLYNFQRLVKRGKFHSIKIVIREKLLTERIQSAMATGTWPGGRKGISQNIDRTNFLGTMSHLQRIVSLLSSTEENFEARALHPTQWGRLCLKKDTNILLADMYSNRSLEMLQNCWHHHDVITFDTKTKNFRPSAISHYYTSNPKLMGKRIYKLISESGREITATEDHPFYTKDGWTDVSELKVGDEVAVYPSLDPIEIPKLPTNEFGLTIVDEKDIIKNCPNRFKHYIKELNSRELLPLTTNNYKIEIIARLLGHIFSDGYCGKYNLEFYCGAKEDAETIARDIRLLGFKPSRIIEKHTKIRVGEKVTNYKTFMLSKGGALRALLALAGVPVGKKPDIEIKIPKWIFKSSLSVKREFLAALLGGDGPKPRFVMRKDRKMSGKVYLDDLIFHKKSDMKSNIVKFSKDIKRLFSEFSVVINKIDIKEDYIRKDSSRMLKCKIIFGKSNSNFMRLLTKVGYRYCTQKEKEANYIGEWLRLRDFAIKKRGDLKSKVRKLYKSGFGPKKISSMLNINYRVVQGWIFDFNRYKNTQLSQNMLLLYNKWLEKSKFGESGAIWEKIIHKEVENLNDIRDFTTVENTHSFIANGFVTHNCPIETPEGTPIGLRKNKALLCSITHEEFDENGVKERLKEIGLKGLNKNE